ncbi:MAG: hypothetical protein XU12_C0001G0175 [Deltaproteobacteria bacterium CSP1-8]|nr:MAG: hypothetical protein XU12_C0001G0175 [Deltaproteobacteria bacterium CSP1-8]
MVAGTVKGFAESSAGSDLFTIPHDPAVGGGQSP